MKLIILDRDGVINRESKHYIKTPDEWKPIPGSLEAIATLNTHGFTIAVATNQSGIARGYYSIETLEAIHEKMHLALKTHGGRIDRIIYCPHHPDEQCLCRKPKPGMLHALGEYYQCKLANVPFVGDRQTDVECAIAAGAKPVLLSNTTFPSLSQWAKSIL